jgi:hypothetical protein
MCSAMTCCTIGRHLVEVAGRCGLVVEDVQATVVLSSGWLDDLRRLDERGTFLFSLNDYAVVCVECAGDQSQNPATVRRKAGR